MNPDSIVTHVVAAVAVIAGLSYLLGRLFRRLWQPEVLGQLFAGVILGPSLLGRFSGHVTNAIFPRQIVPYLNITAQVALVLFLFAAGYELDLRLLRQQPRTVPLISVSAFAVPMLLGVASVLVLGHWYRAVGEPRVTSASFVLFIGVALSITAVPVLASILRDWDMAATLPGVAAITSAAVIDALGWLALAGVLAMANASSSAHRPWFVTALLLIAYVAVIALVVRPMLRWWTRRPAAVLANRALVAVAFAMASAWATAVLGFHVISGAFLAGLLMPRQPDGAPDADVLRPIQDAGRLLLPIFFIVAGLSVNIGMLSAGDFALFGVICGLAVVGKIGAGTVAARLATMGKRDAAVVGVLLNTRGLTELIVLNVGLQTGIIHQRLYTILVLMALTMTAVSGPLLALLRLPDGRSGFSGVSDHEIEQ